LIRSPRRASPYASDESEKHFRTGASLTRGRDGGFSGRGFQPETLDSLGGMVQAASVGLEGAGLSWRATLLGNQDLS